MKGQARAMERNASSTREPWPKLFARVFRGNMYCIMLAGTYCTSASVICSWNACHPTNTVTKKKTAFLPTYLSNPCRSSLSSFSWRVLISL